MTKAIRMLLAGAWLAAAVGLLRSAGYWNMRGRSTPGGSFKHSCSLAMLWKNNPLIYKRPLLYLVFLASFFRRATPIVARVFKEIARLTKGAHCAFTPGAAKELADLLRAVAAYAVGGRNALLANKTAAASKLLLQLPPR